MNRGRRQNRGPRTNVLTQMRTMERRINRRMMGHDFVPSIDPGTFVQRPWNSWTYERTDFSESEFQGLSVTVTDIMNQILGKNKVPEGGKVVIKIQKSAIWCTAASLIQPDVECKFYELNEKTVAPQQPRSIQRDVGTLNRPAKCGYVFPVADSKEILYSAEGALLVTVATPATTGSKVTTRINVLWQFEDSA